jgi:magnesium-transporting ATPase (P-type)
VKKGGHRRDKTEEEASYVFKRTQHRVVLSIHGQEVAYEILNVIHFNSARKRMSVIVRTPEGLSRNLSSSISRQTLDEFERFFGSTFTWVPRPFFF